MSASHMISDLNIPLHLESGKVSPILSNLVLHELDCFINKLITETMAIDTRGAFVVKQYYVRYGDEWLIGWSCLQPQAVQIKSKIKEFLNNELLLELSEEKILITKAETSKVKFLETELSSVSSVRGGIKHYRDIRGDQGSTLVPPIVMRMDAPYHCLINKLIDKGIVKIGRVAGGNTGIVPQPILNFSNLPINEIILRYRVILNEVFNYYSFVDNRPRLIVVYWILRKSLAKTLATKLRLKSSRQVYLKFGINIKYKIPNTGVSIDFARPSLAVSPKNFIETTVFKSPLGRLGTMNAKRNEFEKQRTYSTVAGSSNKKVHPYFITGFTDGEGCFSISIIQDGKTNTG